MPANIGAVPAGQAAPATHFFDALVEQIASDDLEKAIQRLASGYSDLLEKVAEGEIDINTAMQIFDGRRP